MKPLFNQLFANPIPNNQTSQSGLSTSSQSLKSAIVKYVGEGLPGRPMTVKEGETVLFEQNTGLPWEGGIFLREEQIIAIL